MYFLKHDKTLHALTELLFACLLKKLKSSCLKYRNYDISIYWCPNFLNHVLFCPKKRKKISGKEQNMAFFSYFTQASLCDTPFIIATQFSFAHIVNRRTQKLKCLHISRTKFSFLFCNVTFHSSTSDNALRHGIFKI